MKTNRWFQTVGAAIALGATVIALFQSVQDLRKVDVLGITFERQVDELPQQEEFVESLLDNRVFTEGLFELFRNEISVGEGSPDAARLVAQISEVRDQIKSNAEATLALRQAINPANPEEILTIARLSDRVAQLDERLDILESDLDQKFVSFTKSVVREIDASSGATNLIIIALIPLVLNLGYTIWKDRRGSQGEGANERNT